MKTCMNWEIVTEEKAEVLAALARLAAAEVWTFEELCKAAAPFFAAPEGLEPEGETWTR